MKMQRFYKCKKLIGILVISMILTCFPTVTAKASTTSPEQQFREFYLRLLETGDNSVQDISSLNLPYMTCYYIMNDIRENEGHFAYQCYNEYTFISIDKIETRDDGPYLLQFHMDQTDTGFTERYATVKNLVAEVQKNVDAKMTDLDKLLYFHEFVVANITYINTNAESNHLGGATLANGYGVCEGYARALMMFLKAENIPCVEVAGGNHAWIAVKIDGEWYLVDPTWDDTRASRYGTHYFFLRNDDEFYNTMASKHEQGRVDSTCFDSFSGILSTSTKYTNWYVHNVWNPMYYYDGYWYYVFNNAIRKNNIQGTDESILCEGTNLKITGIDGRYLNYSNNGAATQLDLGEKTITTPPTTPENPDDGSNTPTTPENPGDGGNTPTTPENPDDGGNTPTTPQNTNDNSTDNGDSTPPEETPEDEKSTEDEEAIEDDTVTATQAIRVRTPIIKSVTNKKGKKAKIVLKEKVAGATGYEVKISTNKKFKKSVKTATFNGTSKSISKLKKNKTYYVKVRAYKKDANGKKIYGSYSSVVKVKIKK